MASFIKKRNALFLFKGHEILKTMTFNLFHKTKVRSKKNKKPTLGTFVHQWAFRPKIPAVRSKDIEGH